MFFFILIWPTSWNKSITTSASSSWLNRQRLTEWAWCCKPFAALLLFKYFSICSTNNNSRFQVYLVLIGPYLYWRERGWVWSQISRHEENMEFYNYLLFFPLWLNLFAIMKKSTKNCTLYHVVNKSVWADIRTSLAPVYWCYLCWQHQ